MAHTYPDTIRLAIGTSTGRRELSHFGIPTCYVAWNAEGENIDLFPEGYLWNHGCTIERGDQHYLTTLVGTMYLFFLYVEWKKCSSTLHLQGAATGDTV